jgi:hypothetical protein
MDAPSSRAVINDRHLTQLAELMPLIGARSTSAMIEFVLDLHLQDEIDYQKSRQLERRCSKKYPTD